MMIHLYWHVIIALTVGAVAFWAGLIFIYKLGGVRDER